MNILFTAGGSPGNELIYRTLKLKHDIWFADADLDRISHIIPNNRKILVPLVEQSGYFKKIIDFCFREKIELIVPGIDEELLRMHQSFKLIKQTSLFLPSELFISNMLDKYTSMQTLENLDIPVPLTLKLEEAQKFNYYPLILKPRWGRGSRGIQIVKTQEELELYTQIKKINNQEYICQTYEEGDEYTVQILNCNNQKNPLIIPLKVLLKKGVTLTAEIDFDENIIKLCKKIAINFNEGNIYNVQLIRTFKDNSLRVFEVNPRFSTTTCILTSIGVDPFKLDANKIEQSELQSYQGLKLNRTLTNSVV
jgi:carbamoyl-phosphate synthase large subunit